MKANKGMKMESAAVRAEKLRNIFAVLILLAGIAGAAYVGLWLMLIQPILACCKAFDNGTFTAVLLGRTVLKCIFASMVGGLIVKGSYLLSAYVKYNG